MNSPLLGSFDAFRRRVAVARRIVLTTHVNPDGDGLGSMLALGEFLRLSAEDVRIIEHSFIPQQYRFLDPDGSRIEQFSADKHAAVLQRAELIVIVDTNHPDRTVSMASHILSSAAPKVIIDHHPDPDAGADLSIIDESACATGQIVFRMLEHFHSPISRDAATALYTAIMTDTGSFRYPKTDGAVHRIVGQLIDAGADPVNIYQQVYEQGPPNRLQLLGETLAGLRLAHDGRVAYLTVTRDMFLRTGTSEPDTDAFVPYTLSIGGVAIGLMFTELNDGAVKVNFRSKGAIRVNTLAKYYGGNGHRNAAGARIKDGRLAELIPDVVMKAGELLSQGSRNATAL